MILLQEGRTQGICDGYHHQFEDILHGSQSIQKYFPDLVSKTHEIWESIQQLSLKSEKKKLVACYALLILR